MFRRALTALLLFTGAGATQAATRPVVVELFTSEGCSSCPPADAFLTELARTRSDVLPLAFHITYWDQLGWKDPYGLAAATARQARYGARFGDGSYTPEMVVDGRKGLVGSDRRAADAAIAAAATEHGAAPNLAVTRTGSGLSIKIAGGHGPASIVLVGYDPQHQTIVGRGENSGRSLVESNIVRSLRTIGQWNGAPLTLAASAPAGAQAAVLLEAPNGFTLMASDTAPGMEFKAGNNVTISLSGNDAEELRGYWKQLSNDGVVTVPMEKQMWGDEFGACIDKFGLPWMVNITAQ